MTIDDFSAEDADGGLSSNWMVSDAGTEALSALDGGAQDGGVPTAYDLTLDDTTGSSDLVATLAVTGSALASTTNVCFWMTSTVGNPFTFSVDAAGLTYPTTVTPTTTAWTQQCVPWASLTDASTVSPTTITAFVFDVPPGAQVAIADIYAQ